MPGRDERVADLGRALVREPTRSHDAVILLLPRAPSRPVLDKKQSIDRRARALLLVRRETGVAGGMAARRRSAEFRHCR